jgi:hypothetical protein
MVVEPAALVLPTTAVTPLCAETKLIAAAFAIALLALSAEEA